MAQIFMCIECESLTGWFHVYHAEARQALRDARPNHAKIADQLAMDKELELLDHQREVHSQSQRRLQI